MRMYRAHGHLLLPISWVEVKKKKKGKQTKKNMAIDRGSRICKK